jgi:hypothetical protein
MKKLLVILLVLGMAAPAMAAEWNFYGNARMNLGSYARSKEWTGGSGANWASNTPFNNDDTDTNWALQSNSRIGANVKASDQVSGRFEYGTGVNVRLLYGVWNFGPGKLIVGQDYTPIDILYSNQIGAIKTDGDEDMLSTGMTYESRLPQIKLNIQGFELALISPKTSTVADLPTYTGTDTTLPKVEVAYTFATDMFSIKPYLGYNSTKVETTGASQDSEDVTSMVYGLAFKVMLGPAYINGNVIGATNAANYGLYTIAPAGSTAIGYDTDTKDATRVGGAILVGFKVSDMVTLEAGYGMINDENKVGGVKTETSISTAYINAGITLAPGVIITPEYGMMDLGDLKVSGTKTKQGDISYIAAKMQINF